jgi:hypothetical protein
MGLDFLKNYGGSRLDQYPAQPSMTEMDEKERDAKVDQEYETNGDSWEPKDLDIDDTWRPGDWDERPIRFVDGKDVGETIAWLQAPSTRYPIPVRFSQIGAVVMRLIDGQCRREFEMVERTISMYIDAFPWHEIESFAADLQANGYRLLPARPDGGQPSPDFEKMRKANDNRTMNEMENLEKAAISQDNNTPTIIDGRLEPRRGGFDSLHSPVFGVIKTHHRNYLDDQARGVVYRLELGQRTPTFRLKEGDSFSVISYC